MASPNESFRPGDVVWTAFGAGVIVAHKNDDDVFYSVRLWRVPGKSIASSSLAFLTRPSILYRLPAAPGMITRLQTDLPFGAEGAAASSQVLVHCYYPQERMFFVSSLPSKKHDNDTRNNTAESLHSSLELLPVAPSQLVPTAPGAKIYPILEALMNRAEETAVATRNLLEKESTLRFVDQTSQVVQDTAGRLWTASQQMENNNNTPLEKLTLAAQQAAPQANETFKQVLTMVKDEQLTDLLETCRNRLKELVQTTDLSETTQLALKKTGIRILVDSENESLTAAAALSRKAALSAVERLLQQTNLDPADLNSVRDELSTNFNNAFDSLSTAARSDRGLNELFESIAEKTTVWQQATGRLLQTRSASLFLEGASRLQARAASIMKKGHMDWAGEIGSKLTKSFTEGDAALARIKSIELGEAVKTRLVEAIEVRSESLGGLDGIIAGALATIKTKKDAAENPIQNLLLGLQSNATSVTTDARETLITVLSSRSKYRDLALVRLERVMCNLESQLGDEMTPEDIAAIARGDGGTSRIFQPIAKRAMNQIGKQLDAAESQVSDKTILEVLSRVRKIMSGEMPLSALMDEVVAVLNSDKIVAAGESLVQHSEHVLDVIEGVSGNKAVSDAIQMVERAGISKDSVMREIGKMDVDKLIGAAGDAVTDERARRKLVSSAIDAALDFALRVLPSMPVPPFEGVKDGLVYQISNLSMEGFRVRKEDIQIELAGLRAVKRKNQSSAPAPDEASNGDEKVEDGIESLSSFDSMDAMNESVNDSVVMMDMHTSVKATELLTIDISNVSAVLDQAVWSFEQTYMPYLKGNGLANVKMSGGAIRLRFELRRHLCVTEDGETWKPVLCLHDRSCRISDVDLNLEGEGKLTWILNKLAGIFRNPLRDYVVRTIVRVLTNRSGWILQRLNEILSPYWDLILRTAKLSMNDLVIADDQVVVAVQASAAATLIELVWRESLPLGMNLLTNDESGLLKVVDFPRGSQARVVCEKRNLNPDIFEGATLIAVNGTEYDDSDELFDALRDPGRPKTVRFRLAENGEVERLRQFVEGPKSREAGEATPRQIRRNCELELRKVAFLESGELGIEFGTLVDGCALVVNSFLQHEDGIVFAAEKSGMIRIGDILASINEESVAVMRQNAPAQAIKLLEEMASRRPLTLSFCDPYVHCVRISQVPDGYGADSNGGPDELILEELQSEGGRRVAVTGFEDVSGMAESSGILIGDHLVFLNGTPVGAGCRWLDGSQGPSLDEIQGMLQDESAYPIGLTFARPRRSKGPLRDDDADTICVTAESRQRIGCFFDTTEYGDVVVTDFHGVPGVFQRTFTSVIGSNKMTVPLSVDAVNGQFVPSYASVEMVRNAIKRGWKSENSLEVVLCDDELKIWLHGISAGRTY